MANQMFVRIEARFSGFLFWLEPWRAVPSLGATVVLGEDDILGCVIEFRAGKGEPRYGVAYVEEEA